MKKLIRKAKRGCWFKNRSWLEHTAPCVISIECRFVYFHLTHLSFRDCVLSSRSHTPPVQGFKVSVCHVCTRAFLHVFYVSFTSVFFSTFVRLHIQSACVFFASLCSTYVCGFLDVLCSLFEVLMFSLEELAVKKSYSEDAVCRCRFVLHANAAWTPTGV